jgi:hypothetical protein
VPGNCLPFVIQDQQCSEWCWAAVVSSVATFVNSNQQPQQCEVVDREAFSPHNPTPGCCSASNRCIPKNLNCVCNRTGPVGFALQDYELTANPDGQMPSSNTFSIIAQQIDQLCVVVIQVFDRSTPVLAHVMVVVGYSGTDTLIVADPADAGSSHTYSYSELVNPDPAAESLSRWQLSRFFTLVPRQS